MPNPTRTLHAAILLALVFSTATAVFAVPANLITNGSFEEASQAPPYPTELRLSAGSTVITGWTVTGDGIDYMGNRWAPSDGLRSVDLNKDGPGGLLSQVSTIVHGQYDLVFDMAGNPDPAPPLRTLAVMINSVEVATFTFDATGKTATNMGWLQKSLRFTASTSQTTIEFVSRTDAGRGPMLDNVRLYPSNHAPTAPTLVTITPAKPKGGQSLYAEATGSADSDSDAITYEYAWEKSTDGGQSWLAGPAADTVPDGVTVRGQAWRAKARARDWLEASGWVTSAPVTILNGLPSPPTSVKVLALAPSLGFGLQGRCSGATDPDHDPLRLIWRWWKSTNGTDWVSGPAGRILPSSATAPGEYWKVSARASDGTAVSQWAYSLPIRVGSVKTPAMTATAYTRGSITQIVVSLSAAATISVKVANMSGRAVATLAPRDMQSGVCTLAWNGRSSAGSLVPRGTYLLRVEAVASDGGVSRLLVPVQR
jgi:choice-of-anchor C domain-containing protein